MFVKFQEIGNQNKKSIKKMNTFSNRHNLTFFFCRTNFQGVPKVVVLGQENEFGDFMYREIYFFTMEEAYQHLKNQRGF